MRLSLRLLFSFAALQISIVGSGFAQVVPAEIGRLKAPEAIDSAILIPNSSGELFALHTAGGKLGIQKQEEGGFVERNLDLGSQGIVEARELKAYNRFTTTWMAFFIATDTSGNESLRALEFDTAGELALSPFGTFDIEGAEGEVREYSVVHNSLGSFYVTLRKNAALAAFFIGYDWTDKTFTSVKQSLDPRDDETATMFVRMDRSRLLVAADYLVEGSLAYHTTLLALEEGEPALRADLGLHDTPLLDLKAYAPSALDERLLLRRARSVAICDFSGSQEVSAREYSYGEGLLLGAELDFPGRDDVLVLALAPEGVNLLEQSVNGGASRTLFSIPLARRAFAAYRFDEEAARLEYLVTGIAEDGSLLARRAILSSPDGVWEDGGEALRIPGSADRAQAYGFLVEEPAQGYSILVLDPADALLDSISLAGSSALTIPLGRFHESPLPADLFALPFEKGNNSNSPVARNDTYALLLSGPAWLPLGPSGGRGGDPRYLIAVISDDELVIYTIEE